MSKQIIKFKYKFSEEYNPVYANGAYCGVSPQGEIVLNFYLERPSLPIMDQIEKNEDNTLGERKTIQDAENALIRYVSTGVVLNIETAKRINEWLGQAIEAMEKLREDNLKNMVQDVKEN